MEQPDCQNDAGGEVMGKLEVIKSVVLYPIAFGVIIFFLASNLGHELRGPVIASFVLAVVAYELGKLWLIIRRL